MHTFYTTDIQGDLARFDEEETGHALRTLRLKSGDAIRFTDGQGMYYEGLIVSEHKKGLTANIESRTPGFDNPTYPLHIAIAPTKNIDRLEWFLEKSTEMGIATITLLQTKRTERQNVRADRLQKILVSAMKQSMRARLPVLHNLMPLKTFLEQPTEGYKWIAHCIDEQPRATFPGPADTKAPWTILIGPEGDFTPDEVELALKNGYIPLSLGDTRLRTETAAVYATAVWKFSNPETYGNQS